MHPSSSMEAVRWQGSVPSQRSQNRQTQNKIKTQTPIESSSRVHKAKDLLTTNLASPLGSCQINNTSKATDVPPVSVPQPSELTSRRLFKANAGHHSRLFASGRARDGLPKRTKKLNIPSAKPFLLLSWGFLRSTRRLGEKERGGR